MEQSIVIVTHRCFYELVVAGVMSGVTLLENLSSKSTACADASVKMTMFACSLHL